MTVTILATAESPFLYKMTVCVH